MCINEHSSLSRVETSVMPFHEYTLCEIVCEIWFQQKIQNKSKQETYIIRPGKHFCRFDFDQKLKKNIVLIIHMHFTKISKNVIGNTKLTILQIIGVPEKQNLLNIFSKSYFADIK